MELRNRKTGAVVTEQQFRSNNPNTSFPEVLTSEMLDSFGHDPVLEGPQPTLIAPYQYSQRDGVVEVNGQWFTHYIAVELDVEGKAALDAQQAERIRTSRNIRLTSCDWTQLSDAPVDAVVWASYRQALRDITSQPGFPYAVTWPEEPTT